MQLIGYFAEAIRPKRGNNHPWACQLGKHQTIQVNEQELTHDQLILASGAWSRQILEPLGYKVDIKPQKGQLLEVETDFSSDKWPGQDATWRNRYPPFDQGRLAIGASHENDKGYDLTVDSQLIEEMKETAIQFIPALKNYPISKTRVGTRAYT